jgi:peptidoglycan/xylan/chitin deacetylase (PgdA/CDA1 family)
LRRYAPPMQSAVTWARPVVDRALRRPAAVRAAALLGAFRGRGLALLWHRVGPTGPRPGEAVRTVANDEFATQLDLLATLGDVVPLAELERPGRTNRPRFALTFDDDDAGHVHHTLPLLLDRGLPATFFLSGRWLTGDGPYWWEVLEARIRVEGIPAVASSYGLPSDVGAPRIAAELTGTTEAAALAEVAVASAPPPMSRSDALQLVDAGMEIGFHTRHHPSLPTLRSSRLREALTAGRDELAADFGVAVDRFAYPHGHVDAAVAVATAAAGYRSAWTTAKRSVVRGCDPHQLGRWDLGHLDADAFRTALLRGLVRPEP